MACGRSVFTCPRGRAASPVIRDARGPPDHLRCGGLDRRAARACDRARSCDPRVRPGRAVAHVRPRLVAGRRRSRLRTGTPARRRSAVGVQHPVDRHSRARSDARRNQQCATGAGARARFDRFGRLRVADRARIRGLPRSAGDRTCGHRVRAIGGCSPLQFTGPENCSCVRLEATRHHRAQSTSLAVSLGRRADDDRTIRSPRASSGRRR